ncbi:uncharacterized protein EKO05_0007203 [Ascochyta rabiei]|uniref:Uncharacterized protein n=1 Tax=Didymella rabiei TaxID=5454 RepID=A0A162ZL06_DIDRA|nr:uncharacterized protein EKO05_0007203 [Ascochyta rabiei]KZM20666.1 hypothetical protein ST47_g8174 [Ascochyta rabiei]UPX16820.1 hypothetical protein EKO05_0007203 [Ascochyta rabiei]
MLAKSVFAATMFALAQFAVASPPGCLLGAVNEYANPADMKSVCKDKDAATKIASACGDDTKAALSAFAEVCADQGVKVATDAPTSTSGSSIKPSGTGASASASGTGSIIVSPSGNATLATATGAAPTPTSATGTSTTGPPESTGAAGKLEVSLVAAFAGLMAIAL